MKARLVILGALHRGDLHPYEIKRRLEAAMVECYLDLDVGSLYYAIRQLEKDGSIVPVAQERVARGGMRTIYSLTAQGRAEFQQGFFELFEGDGPVSQTLYGAVLFLHCVDRARLAEALRKKIARTEELIAELKPLRAEMTGESISTGGQYLFRHIEKQRRLDLDWLKALLTDVNAGRVRAGTPRSQ
jgi:DNA-binding PadR family transcriptional regulator